MLFIFFISIKIPSPCLSDFYVYLNSEKLLSGICMKYLFSLCSTQNLKKKSYFRRISAGYFYRPLAVSMQVITKSVQTAYC